MTTVFLFPIKLILVFNGLQPEFENSIGKNGPLFRIPTMSYKRPATSAACMKAGSESFWKAKCNRSKRAVLTRTLYYCVTEYRDRKAYAYTELHTCRVRGVGNTSVSIIDVFRLTIVLSIDQEYSRSTLFIWENLYIAFSETHISRILMAVAGNLITAWQILYI
jgi:hypothetical protein